MGLTEKINDCITHHRSGENKTCICYFPTGNCPYKGHVNGYDIVRHNYHKERVSIFDCHYPKEFKENGQK